MTGKEQYAKTPEISQPAAFLIPNPEIRGVGEPYALQATFKEASAPLDPTLLSGSNTTIPMWAIPSPIIGKLIRLPDGSASAPSLSWAAETTSGLYRSAANTFHWLIAGTESQRWTSSGIRLYGDLTLLTIAGASAITLSTSTPSAARLSIASASAAALELYLSPTSNPISLKASTVSSQSVLTLGFNTAAPTLRLDPSTGTDVDLTVSTESSQSVLTVLFGTASPTFRLDGTGSPADFTLSTESAQTILTLSFATSNPSFRLDTANLEFSNDRYLCWRNGADSQYIEVIGVNSADTLLLGLHTADMEFYTDDTLQWTIEDVTGTLLPNACAIGGSASGDRVTELHSTLIYGYTRAEIPLIKSSGTSLQLATSSAANGQTVNVKVATTSVSTSAGASVTASSLVPAGSFILGVLVRVTTAVTGATSFDVGDGTDVDRWGAAISINVNTTTSLASFTANGYGQFTAANNVVLTANGSNFTGGAVRVTVYYFDMTAPTS